MLSVLHAAGSLVFDPYRIRMKQITLATATLLAISATLRAAVPHYDVQRLPPNSLLNNLGLVPIPQQLINPDIDVFAVNDAGEFSGRHVQYIPNTTDNGRRTLDNFVYLPAPAHGLPTGISYTTLSGLYSGFGHINNNGVLAGGDYESPVVWLPQPAVGLPAGITYLPTSNWAFAHDLNNSGQVVGADAHTGLYVWSPVAANGFAAGITILDSPRPGFISAINNRGDVIINTGGYPYSGMLYLPRNEYGLGAGRYSIAGAPNDINDFGQIVGDTYQQISPGKNRFYPFIWTASSGLVDLNTLIPPNSGWVLETAAQINNRSDIIGTGTFNGQPASFFLTIPEPTVLPALLVPAFFYRRRCTSSILS